MYLALLWGALWGPALGLWLLADPLLDYHRLRPESLAQWLVVVSSLVLAFAVVGAVLSVFGGLTVVLVESLRRRTFADRVWTYAMVVPPLLGLVYLLDSAFVGWTIFGAPGLDPRLGPAIAATLILLVLAVVAYRFIRRLPQRPDPRWLGWLLCLSTIVGGIHLAAGEQSGTTEIEMTAPLQRSAWPPRETAPLLFVGIDSGNWRVLSPLLDAGRLPTLSSLVTRGSRGTIRAAWPPHWSAPAWGAIVTGHPREQTQVFEDLAVRAPGLPVFEAPLTLDWRLNPLLAFRPILTRAGVLRLTPPPRELLQRAPIWERLHHAGSRVAVVRFRFTFPAADQASMVISDWVGRDYWDRMGVSKDASDHLVSPRSMTHELVEPFTRDEPAVGKLLGRLFPPGDWPLPADAVSDPIEMLSMAADIDFRTFEATRRIMAIRPDMDLVAVYLGGFDWVCHAFWQYRFPEDYPNRPPSSADAVVLGPVVDRYAEYLDAELGRLLAEFPSEPNVIIVSDHGHSADEEHPLWRGGHSDEALIIAAGPDLPRQSAAIDASYLDVAPLILQALGFHKPPDMRGASPLRNTDRRGEAEHPQSFGARTASER